MYRSFKEYVDASRKSPSEAEPFSRFEFVKQLGQGSFSEVWLVRDRASRAPFALKVVSKQRTVEQRSEAQVYTERLVLQQQLCPEAVQLFSGFQDPRYLYYQIEYAEGRTLAHYLQKHQGGLGLNQKRNVLKSIIGLLERIHAEGIVHCDLKPENILMDGAMNLKLADFGCAKVVHLPGRNDELFAKFEQIQQRFAGSGPHNAPQEMFSDPHFQEAQLSDACAKLIRVGGLPGTLKYLAPEAIRGEPFGFSNDLWALGVIAGLIFTGRNLFGGNCELALIESIERGGFELDSSTPPDVRDFIEGLLTLDRTQRLGCRRGNVRENFDEIRSHRIFSTPRFNDSGEALCVATHGELDLRRSSASLGGFKQQELAARAETAKWLFFKETVTLRTEGAEIRVTRAGGEELIHIFKLDARMQARSPDSRSLTLRNGGQEMTFRLREPVAELWLERIRGSTGA